MFLNIYNSPLNIVLSEHKVPDNLILMPIIDFRKPNAMEIAESYKSRENCVFQFSVQSDTFAIWKQFHTYNSHSLGVWMNSIKPGIKGKDFDNMAINQDEKDESWGWLNEQGVRFIQTDYPKQLLYYLKIKKRHF